MSSRQQNGQRFHPILSIVLQRTSKTSLRNRHSRTTSRWTGPSKTQPWRAFRLCRSRDSRGPRDRGFGRWCAVLSVMSTVRNDIRNSVASFAIHCRYGRFRSKPVPGRFWDLSSFCPVPNCDNSGDTRT